MSKIVRKIGTVNKDGGLDLFDMPVSSDVCFDESDEYSPLTSSSPSTPLEPSKIKRVEVKLDMDVPQEKEVITSDENIEINLDKDVRNLRDSDSDYQDYIWRFSKAADEIFNSNEYKLIIRKIKMKSWINRKLLWLAGSNFWLAKRLDISEEYNILLKEIFIRMSLFNDENISRIKFVLKDNCVEDIMGKRPTIDMELLKGLLGKD